MPRRGLLLSMIVSSLLLGGMDRVLAADTILRMTEAATVPTKPDQIVAQLQASATASTSAEAQQKLNVMMTAAVARARQVPDVTLRTDSYHVWRIEMTQSDRYGKWQANQSVMLTGTDGPALLALVDALQQMGLTTNQLSWRLSPEATKTARRQATEIAVKALRARADEAAGWLGLRFVSFQEVRLDGAAPGPAPIMRRAMAPGMAVPASVPPAAEADNVNVGVAVEADVVLASP